MYVDSHLVRCRELLSHGDGNLEHLKPTLIQKSSCPHASSPHKAPSQGPSKVGSPHPARQRHALARMPAPCSPGPEELLRVETEPGGCPYTGAASDTPASSDAPPRYARLYLGQLGHLVSHVGPVVVGPQGVHEGACGLRPTGGEPRPHGAVRPAVARGGGDVQEEVLRASTLRRRQCCAAAGPQPGQRGRGGQQKRAENGK